MEYQVLPYIEPDQVVLTAYARAGSLREHYLAFLARHSISHIEPEEFEIAQETVTDILLFMSRERMLYVDDIRRLVFRLKKMTNKHIKQAKAYELAAVAMGYPSWNDAMAARTTGDKIHNTRQDEYGKESEALFDPIAHHEQNMEDCAFVRMPHHVMFGLIARTEAHVAGGELKIEPEPLEYETLEAFRKNMHKHEPGLVTEGYSLSNQLVKWTRDFRKKARVGKQAPVMFSVHTATAVTRQERLPRRGYAIFVAFRNDWRAFNLLNSPGGLGVITKVGVFDHGLIDESQESYLSTHV